jgi:hypothetical protein
MIENLKKNISSAIYNSKFIDIFRNFNFNFQEFLFAFKNILLNKLLIYLKKINFFISIKVIVIW